MPGYLRRKFVKHRHAREIATPSSSVVEQQPVTPSAWRQSPSSPDAFSDSCRRLASGEELPWQRPPQSVGQPLQLMEGAVLICDFGGFEPPEMVKRRPVVILRVHPTDRDLVTVVPLSTSRPRHIERHHFAFARNPLPTAMPSKQVWAKADMVSTICIDRLDRCHVCVARRRVYIEVRISDAELAQIRACVAIALGLGEQTRVEWRPTITEET